MLELEMQHAYKATHVHSPQCSSCLQSTRVQSLTPLCVYLPGASCELLANPEHTRLNTANMLTHNVTNTQILHQYSSPESYTGVVSSTRIKQGRRHLSLANIRW